MRKKDLEKAYETKSQVLATFMCIVFDEHFKKADSKYRVYHWNGQGESADESNLKDRELWKIYQWQSKLEKFL